MTSETLSGLDRAVDAVLALEQGPQRRLIALAGAPASGKSTLAAALVAALKDRGCKAALVPMDGFHLPNDQLKTLGRFDRKGAPDTFDVAGLLALTRQLPTAKQLCFPTFDRSRDATVPDGGSISADCTTIIVEGNYLLYDAPLWQELRPLWDLAIYLDVPAEILQERLIARWLEHGLPRDAAEKRAFGNDVPNAALVCQHLLTPDLILTTSPVT